MFETHPTGAFERESTPSRVDAPFVSLDLPFEIARLRADRAYALEHHAGRTLAKYPDLRVVLETMRAGSRLPLHETAERITLQVFAGRVRAWLRYGDNQDLAEGAFAAIDAARLNELECLDDCAFLLTLAWPPAAREGVDEERGSAI